MTATINTLNFSGVTAIICVHLLLLDSQPWPWLFFCVTHFIRITERRLLPILLYSSGFNDFDRSRRFVICRFHHITEWQFRSVPFFHAIHGSLSFYSIVAVLPLVLPLAYQSQWQRSFFCRERLPTRILSSSLSPSCFCLSACVIDFCSFAGLLFCIWGLTIC